MGGSSSGGKGALAEVYLVLSAAVAREGIGLLVEFVSAAAVQGRAGLLDVA